MLRKIALGAGIVIGLLLLSVVALWLFVDANQFKPRIEQAVKDNTGRTLTIDGDLKLSVFPRLALALPKTRLSNRAGDRVSAELESARVAVALFPLLRQQVVVDRIVVTGLKATIERRKDGTTNIDDLIRRDGARPDPAQPATASAPSEFEIGGIQLLGADITLDDKQAGSVYRISNLNLETGRLATRSQTPLSLDASVSSTQPPLAANISVKGRLDVDLAAGNFGGNALAVTAKGTRGKDSFDVAARLGDVTWRASGGAAAGNLSASGVDLTARGSFGTTTLTEARVLAPALAFDPARQTLSVGGLDVKAQGKFAKDSFSAALTAPKLQIDPANASGERAQLTFSLKGDGADAATTDARLVLEGVSGNAAQMSFRQLALNATQQQGARKLVAALAGPASASLDGQRFAADKLVGEVTIEDPAIPQKVVKAALTARVALDHKKQTLDAGLTGRFDDTSAAVDLDVRNWNAPRIGFEASADRFNLDRYLPPPPPAAGNDSADPKVDPKVDLSAIADLNLAGELKVGQLQARNIKVSQLRLVMKAAGGTLDVAPLTMNLYGGSLNGSAGVHAEGNRMTVNATLANVAINPLMKDALNEDLLEGRGNVKLDLSTAGATVNGLKRSLNGSGNLLLRDGAIKGINLGQTLRQANDLRALRAGGAVEAHRADATQKTDFTELSASFAVTNGVARSTDLDVKSPLLRIGGAGAADIGAGTLDYTLRVSVVGTSKGQDGRTLDQLRGLTIPARASGPFEKVSWTIDWGAVAKDALASRAAAQTKEQLAPEAQEQRKKLESRARDALKGVLGR
jgi:AsmA protein